YTDIPVVGIIPRMKTDIFPMRHLGVTPHQEYGAAASDAAVDRLAAIAKEHFDLERVTGLMEQRNFSSAPSARQAGALGKANRSRLVSCGMQPFSFIIRRISMPCKREGQSWS
ncbi:MAG: hypothetical protein D3916_16935, partial [Candidatus Electrothrix sp. MAN1_4]|nr:hypothetical protein [Candidatus Electrothrix sp. MAN1_4]